MLTASVYGNTDPGQVRTNNEDAFIAQAIWDSYHWLLVVIDGLGGYEGGEIAAAIAKNTIIDDVTRSQGHDCLDVIMHAVTEANNAIFNQRNKEYCDMGCVITAAILDLEKKQLDVAHVGDTRLYEYSNKGMIKLTHDHSFVGGLEDAGQISEADAMNHPRRNIIDRIVGDELKDSDTPRFIEAAIFPVSSGSQYLLCSDGLSDMLTSFQMSSILQKGLNVKKKVNRLINLANREGGKDNITAIVAWVRSEQIHSLIKRKNLAQGNRKNEKVKNKRKKKTFKTLAPVDNSKTCSEARLSTFFLVVLAVAVAFTIIYLLIRFAL